MNLFLVIGTIVFVALANNLVFTSALGIAPLARSASSLTMALSVGSVVGVTVALSAVVFWPLDNYVLLPMRLDYLRILLSVIITAILGQAVWAVLNRALPTVVEHMKRQATVAVTNSAVLGAALMAAQAERTFGGAVLWGVGSGLGFLLVELLCVGIGMRLEFSHCPKAFRGFPITILALGLLAIAFGGFAGLSVPG